MLTLPPSVRIYPVANTVDIRCGHDGLTAIVRDQWRPDIFEGYVELDLADKGATVKKPVS